MVLRSSSDPTGPSRTMNLRPLAILGFLLLIPVTVHAQFGQQEPASVVVRVTSDSGEALATSAEVSLTPEGGGFGQELMTNGNPEVQFNVTEQGRYEVEVKATGYKTERTTLEVDGTRHAFFMNITLEPDSAGAGMNPNADLLSPKARREMEKGVDAIKSRNYQEAKKHLLEAQRAAPGDSNINYLLGFTLLELKEYDDAQKYLLIAITLDGKNSAALVTMGRLQLEMGNPAAAVEPLERALSIDATNWRAHWLLADTYRIEADYGKSLQEAQLAIESGKGAADGARIALGQALAGLGKKEEAIKTLQDFVSKAPDGAAKQYAERQIVGLQAQVAAAQLETETAPKVSSTVSAPATESTTANTAQQGAVAMHLTDATATLPSWQPPSVLQDNPKIVPGVACPAESVIEDAGVHVTDLVSHMNSIDATEELIHQPLDQIGMPIETDKKFYDYIVTIGQMRPGMLQVSELRNGTDDPKIFPGGLATLGVPALALVFDPSVRGDYDWTCEGLGDLRGQPAWIMHFVQKKGRPGRLRAYRINGVDHLLSMEGLAWVRKNDFEILRVETDLVHPMPEIQLLADHMDVNYEAVQFRAKGETFWLPSSAQMYFEFRKQRYRRSVTLSHYRLFAVGANEKINQPDAMDESAGKNAKGQN